MAKAIVGDLLFERRPWRGSWAVYVRDTDPTGTEHWRPIASDADRDPFGGRAKGALWEICRTLTKTPEDQRQVALTPDEEDRR